MTANGQLRGHGIYWDGADWRYCDNDARTVDEHQDRPCGHCGLRETSKGHDACIPDLPGVINACCGHGNPREAYVMFKDGRCIRGFDTVQEAGE